MDIFTVLTWLYLYGFVIHGIAFMIMEHRAHPDVLSPFNIIRAFFWPIWTPICVVIILVNANSDTSYYRK